MTNIILKLVTVILLLGNCVFMNAQVTVGSNKAPEPFSLLELANGKDRGLRLPQISTTAQRDAMFTNAAGFKTNPLAKGLQIFNLETKCVETWNGTIWLSLCMESIALTSAPGTNVQTVNSTITNITYLIVGTTTATVTGLPPGIEYSFSGGGSVLTISGTPTTPGTYPYVITLPSGITATGIITVLANTVSAASSSPNVCLNTSITPITHTTTGATGIGTPISLPTGVNASFAGNTITISGTPSVAGTFNYSIPLTGGCGSVNATGTIKVNLLNTVSSASSSPNLYINTSLTPITHTTTGATNIGTPISLPAGVNASFAGNTITISGTPSVSGTFNYSIPLIGGCGSVNATGTITVIAPFTTDVSGNYRLKGKTCFDVKRNQLSECGVLAARIDDFASTKTFTYTFTNLNSTSYSNLAFEVIDSNNLLINKVTDLGAKTLTVTFRNDINAYATGLNKDNAYKFTVIAKFKNASGQDRQITLDASVHDCGCGCSVKSGSNTWLTFMCSNLGADPAIEKMSIAQQAEYSSPVLESSTDPYIYGNLYQWGRKTDKHQVRNSGTASGPLFYPSSDIDANGQPAGSYVGKFITSTTNWRTPHDNTLWAPSKTINDPCPDGWRIPTRAEWESVINNNLSVWNSTGTRGVKISPFNNSTYTLFLPAAGKREGGGNIVKAGTDGYYWSSTTDASGGTTSYGQFMYFENPIATLHVQTQNIRVHGMSIRCVAE